LELVVTTLGTETFRCIVGVVLLRVIAAEDILLTRVLEGGTGDLESDKTSGGGVALGRATGPSETGEAETSSSSDHCKCKMTFLVAHLGT
jgi:hypothetical protein